MNRPVVLQPATPTPLQPNHTETPTHIETRYLQSQIHNNVVYKQGIAIQPIKKHTTHMRTQ